MPTANEVQHGGTHYVKHGRLQHWDVVAHFGLGYFEGQATKYLFRWRDKGGILDLEKAIHYIQKLIELEQGKGADPDIVERVGLARAAACEHDLQLVQTPVGEGTRCRNCGHTEAY